MEELKLSTDRGTRHIYSEMLLTCLRAGHAEIYASRVVGFLSGVDINVRQRGLSGYAPERRSRASGQRWRNSALPVSVDRGKPEPSRARSSSLPDVRREAPIERIHPDHLDPAFAWDKGPAGSSGSPNHHRSIAGCSIAGSGPGRDPTRNPNPTPSRDRCRRTRDIRNPTSSRSRSNYCGSRGFESAGRHQSG